MKKMFKMMIILGCAFCTIPVFATCSSEKAGTVSGAACSIAELKSQEMNRTEKGRTNLGDMESKGEMNLRPVQMNTEVKAAPNGACVFGMCLYKSLLDK